MKKYLLLIFIVTIVSCQSSKLFLVKDTVWMKGIETDYSKLEDTVNGHKYYYNAIKVDKYIHGEIPDELFLHPRFDTKEAASGNSEISGDLKVDKLSKSVLDNVNFNIDTDTIYFVIKGNIIVYSSPTFNKEQATNVISLHSEYEWNITNPPIRALYKDDIPSTNKYDIFRTFYYYPKQKRYLIKDCFEVENGFMHFVYIFQSLTDDNKNTNPREWRTMWDVTSPQHIFNTVQLFKSANALSIKNRISN